MSRAPRGGRFPAALGAPQQGMQGDPRPRAMLRPQRPMDHAAQEAARSVVPSGLGLDSATVRARMVGRLSRSGVTSEAVLQAMAAVERHRFVDSALANQAYEDTSLPIGHGQTISKPSVVARMLGLLFEGRTAASAGSLGRVLEVGTGCGYQTALLARLARRVASVERILPLHERARANLDGAEGRGNVRLIHGDGRLGHPPWAPYDSILAAAGGTELPAAWLEQLAEGGRLVAPCHDAAAGGQVLWVIDRTADGWREQRVGAVHFVPLESGKI